MFLSIDYGMEDFGEALGRAIKERRKELGLSQEALSFKAGYHVTYVSQIERNVKSPTVRTMVIFAGALEMPLSELILRAERLYAHYE